MGDMMSIFKDHFGCPCGGQVTGTEWKREGPWDPTVAQGRLSRRVGNLRDYLGVSTSFSECQ